MLATLRPTLFQCMVRSPNHVYDLRRMFTNGSRHNRVTNMRPRVPGSLGQDMDDPHSGTWVIGSLTMCVMGYSVFVFSNGKIKISGGSKEYSTKSVSYETWLADSVVAPVMNVLDELNENDKVDYDWEICLLNGSMSIHKIKEYKQVCHDICERVNRPHNTFFVSATMPVCFQPNGWLMKGGRVCSIAIQFGKPNEKNGRFATARFDHGGHVQFFALKSMEHLQRAGSELVALLEPIMHRDVDHVRTNEN